MAISAAIVLDRSQSQANQKVRAVLTVSNSGGNAVSVLNVSPFVKSAVQPNPNATVSAIGQVVAGQPVPAGGSLVLVWDTMIQTVNPPSNYDSAPANNNYNIGCLVYSDDGSIVSPTVQPVQIIPNKKYGSF
jgi:hypothetical protein